MRKREKSLKHGLSAREAGICRRIAEARHFLGIDQGEAARRIGIPKSTLSNYELCVSPVKADLALRICRQFVLSEEWLATGRFDYAEKAGQSRGISADPAFTKIYIRQCMDLLGSSEASSLPIGELFSVAFDASLGRVYADRIKRFYYQIGIPASAWKDKDIELGVEILRVLVERSLLFLMNEAMGKGYSKEHAAAAYLGFMMRMGMFGFGKCMGDRVTSEDFRLPIALFADPRVPISAFKTSEQIQADERFGPMSIDNERASGAGVTKAEPPRSAARSPTAPV